LGEYTNLCNIVGDNITNSDDSGFSEVHPTIEIEVYTEGNFEYVSCKERLKAK